MAKAETFIPTDVFFSRVLFSAERVWFRLGGYDACEKARRISWIPDEIVAIIKDRWWFSTYI